MSMMESHLEWETLHDVADGRLDADAAARAERHLKHCATCRESLARLTRLHDGARVLARDVPPPDDLWPHVRASIEGRRSASPVPVVADDLSAATPAVSGRSRASSSRYSAHTLQWLAAAAITIIVLSSGVTALVLRRGEPTLARALPASYEQSERSFTASVSDLQVLFDRRRSELAPHTVRIVERSIATIDSAISEMRLALMADPANAEIARMLNASYQQKLELLRRASDFITSS